MKVSNGKNAIIALLFIICACGIGATAQTLRVMTYNIRNGIGMDEKADIKRTAEVIRRHGADIVALQEVDSCTNRSNCTDIAKQLAEATGMHATFVPAIDYDGGRYGVALLSRTQPVSIRRIPLPGREERRTAVIAEFPDYAVCCTHLSLTPDDQIASVGILTDTLPAIVTGKPIILMGDFNAEPGSTTIEALRQSFTLLSDPEVHTWPADSPSQTLDYIFTSDPASVTAVSAPVVPSEAVTSDHRPIFIDLKITQQP